MSTWVLSSSSDPRALAIVDGLGRFSGLGPHYSRRTPGSRTFTGIGQEIVLVTDDEAAVWAVVRQRVPAPRGSGASRGRAGVPNTSTRFVWRNNMFRNLSGELSSDLIRAAVETTYREWARRYGSLPVETLRTEIDPARIRSQNPGYCYKRAGWHHARTVRGKVFLDAPCPTLLLCGTCACCEGSSLQVARLTGFRSGGGQ